MKRLRPSARGSMRKLCSPSTSPGMMKRPSQRNSCSGWAASTVGLKVIGLAFGGSMRTSRVEPTVKSPASFVMNGFQSGYAPVSVRIDQTAAGGASISIDRSIVLDILDSFESTLTRSIQVQGPGDISGGGFRSGLVTAHVEPEG